MRHPALMLSGLAGVGLELGLLLSAPAAGRAVEVVALARSSDAAVRPPRFYEPSPAISPAAALPPAAAPVRSDGAPSWRLVNRSGPAPNVRLIPDPQRMPAASVSTDPDPVSIPEDNSTFPAQAEAQPPAPRRRSRSRSRIPADAQAVPSARRPPAYLLSPIISGAVPSGYVGGWGDYYLSASAGTPGKLRDGSPDASFNIGFGLGDPVRNLGLGVYWGIGSFKKFNGNGSVSVAAGRILVNRPNLLVGVAGGLLDAYAYGFEAGKPQVNGYGAVSVTVPLRPTDRVFPQRLQFSAGAGGNSFSSIDSNFATNNTGIFGSVGVELTPYLGLSFGQSSRGSNVNVSFIPFRTLPIFVNLIGADLFNNTPFGTVGVLSVGWGDNIRRGFFNQ